MQCVYTACVLAQLLQICCFCGRFVGVPVERSLNSSYTISQLFVVGFDEKVHEKYTSMINGNIRLCLGKWQRKLYPVETETHLQAKSFSFLYVCGQASVVRDVLMRSSCDLSKTEKIGSLGISLQFAKSGDTKA